MTEQAMRRLRRGASRKKTALLRGVATAVAATVLMVCVFAVIIGFADIGDQAIRIVNQVIKAAAVVLGVCAATARGDKAAPRRGALIGLIYMALGVLLYALLTGQRLTVWGYLVDVLMGVAAGGLTGMARAGMTPR